MRQLTASTLAALLLIISMATAGAQCLEAERVEIIEGRLTEGRFTDAAGRPEDAFILILPTPLCLSGNEETDNVDETRSVQLFSSNDAVDRKIARLVDGPVVVQGKPFGAMTVHRRAPIVMDVVRIDPDPRRASATPGIVEPRRGTALRAELLDTARPIFQDETGGEIEFVVKRLAVFSDWAFGEVRLQRPSGVPIDWRRTRYAEDYRAGMFDPSGSFFLLHRTDGIWVVLDYATGPTDVTWDGWRHEYDLPMALFQR